MRNEIYHDVWIRGNVVRNGDRPCSDRFQVLKNFLQRYVNPVCKFKVLDFGANMGFFSYNTAYAFPSSEVTLVDYEPLLPCIHKLNNLSNTILVHKFMNTEDIKELLQPGFDVAYAMSVLHHFENYEEIIDLFVDSCNNVIFEIGYPEEIPEVNVDRVKPIYEYIRQHNPIQINSWIEHDRPIFYVSKNEKGYKGKVHNGCGEAGRVTFPAIEPQIVHAFKQNMYPGTLNIKMDVEIALKNHFYIANVYKTYPAYLNGLPVYVLLTEEKGNKTKEMEVFSPYKLRDYFNLQNGSEVFLSFENRYLA